MANSLQPNSLQFVVVFACLILNDWAIVPFPMRPYESVCLFVPNTAEAEVDKLLEKFTGVVTAKGGTIGKIDRHGLKRLANTIGRHTEAISVYWEFEGPADTVAELTRVYGLSDVVLRAMVTHRVGTVSVAPVPVPAAPEPASTPTITPTETPA